MNPALPKARPVPPSTASAPASPPLRVTVPTADDLEEARSDALLQLKIGRNAHAHSVIVSVGALAIAGVLVLVFQPDLRSPTATYAFGSNFVLAFVLAGGLYLSIGTLASKWEAYQLWPWEPHFWASLLALVLNVVLAVLYALALARTGPTQSWPLLPWMYPVALFGVGAPLAATGLAWPVWTPRKTLSVACSIVPAALGVAVVVPSLTASQEVVALAVTLFVSGLLIQTAGSFLHLISSGTRVHEREVIQSGQSRLFRIADDVRDSEAKMRARHRRLLEREAVVSTTESTHRRVEAAHDEARAQLAAMEQELKLRADELSRREEAFIGKAAETISARRSLEDREEDLRLKQQEVARDRSTVSARERTVTEHEAELKRRLAAADERDHAGEARRGNLAEAETRLEARRQDLEQKTSELLHREAELRTRTALAEAPAASDPSGARAAALSKRDAELSQLKLALDEQNALLGRKARQVEATRTEVADRESALAKRTTELDAREGALATRETDLEEGLKATEERRLRYDTAVREYETKAAALDRQAAELEARAASLGARESALRAEPRAAREPRPSGPTAAEGPRPVPAADGNRAPTGIRRLDELLLGGFAPAAQVMVIGDAFVGKEIVLLAAIAEGLRRGETAIVVTARRSVDEVRAALRAVATEVDVAETNGQLRWIDAARGGAGPAGPAGRTAAGASREAGPKGPDDHATILRALVDAARPKGPARPLRVAFLGLAASLDHVDERAGTVFVQNFVGILKPRGALGLYSLEPGSVPDAQVERLLASMDGAIRFRQDGDRTTLGVAGLGEVATREWVECRATSRGLEIGSFTLERIR